MIKIFQTTHFVCVLVALCIILSSCFSTVPDITSVETHFQNNYNSIQTVVDYIINLPYDSIYINKVDGSMHADLETVDIENQNVNSALKHLLENSLTSSRQYYFISKSGNTIIFLQWKSTQDIGCGVAYSINGEESPDIQYCTELVPLTEAGWYYYVDDYNAWRTGKRPGGQGDGSSVPSGTEE